MKKQLVIILLVIYFTILLKLIVFKYPGMIFDGDGNYVPFKTILQYIRGYPTWGVAIRNLGGNIALFIPVGILMAIFNSNLRWIVILAMAIIFGAAMEILQILFRSGIFDIDDIFLNVLGFIVGYVLFILFIKLLNKLRMINVHDNI